MKTTRILSVLVLSLLVLAGGTQAGLAQGNSEGAHLCNHGGFNGLVGASGETFRNAGQCASFVAQGGVFATGMIVPAGQAATLDATLESCNALSWGYETSGGASGTGQSKGAVCATSSGGSVTIGPFATATILTISLTDETCGATYDSSGNHAAVGQSGSGYVVNISDAGPGCGLIASPAIPAGMGNLQVVVSIGG